jgi:hypothetical protein
MDKKDPKYTMAYNHYKIDGDKPVISNLMFKETLDSDNPYYINEILNLYALDPLQKNLLLDKQKQLNEAATKKNLPPL